MTSSSTYCSNISFSLHIQHLSKKQAYPAKNRSCTIVQKHQETTNVQQKKREKQRSTTYSVQRITTSKECNCSTEEAKLFEKFNLWLKNMKK